MEEEWKKCPSCNGSIPKFWQRHDKCGWNSTKPAETVQKELPKATPLFEDKVSDRAYLESLAQQLESKAKEIREYLK